MGKQLIKNKISHAFLQGKVSIARYRTVLINDNKLKEKKRND